MILILSCSPSSWAASMNCLKRKNLIFCLHDPNPVLLPILLGSLHELLDHGELLLKGVFSVLKVMDAVETFSHLPRQRGVHLQQAGSLAFTILQRYVDHPQLLCQLGGFFPVSSVGLG